jgi:hypothetical protein
MKNESKNPSPEFLNQLIRKLRAQYSVDPNIKHISWGLGRSKGKLNKGVCIIFSVNQKTGSERLRKTLGTKAIPELIEGIPTDVMESKPYKLASPVGSRGDVIADPLNGGWSTSNADNHIIWFNGWGTIGLLCTDNDTGDLMALSNWHVWADGGEEGDTIIQPGSPRAGDHVEGVTKVLACGPLFTSLLEWESPDPIALGLYGGAAAAALAAALSDYRDPSRRGQDATHPKPGEKTTREKIIVDTVYKDLPIPGTPFKTDVKWDYTRFTTGKNYEHSVSEGQINAQFLLGKYVTSNKKSYNPGEEATIYAAIWDYQPRPCDGYHVVAHLIPESNPSVAYPVVLHPTTCPKGMPWYPPDKKNTTVCYDFGKHKPGSSYPYKYNFDWLQVYNISQTDLLIVDWQTSNGGRNRGELMIGQRGLRFKHNPASGVHVTVAAFTSQRIQVKAYDHHGTLLGTTTSSGTSGAVEVLHIAAQGIADVVVTGGGGEGVVLKYCVDTELANEQGTTFSPDVYKRLETAHVKFKSIDAERAARANRCCFQGSFRIPPSEKKGKWNIYLTVQNVNNVPQGTEPEIAATIIGGHLLAVPAAQVAGCLFMMLGDHVFDIF